MRILVWGLGYVGTVTAACLAELGNEVIGVETNLLKVEAITKGDCTIQEPGLKELIKKVVESGNLKATTEGTSLVDWADISIVCVGTPSASDGSPDFRYIEQVSIDIGLGLQSSKNYHVIVIRSTLFPGVTRNLVCSKLAEHSNKTPIKDFGVVINPEFMREANAINDFFNPPYIVIGEMEQKSADIVEKLYQKLTTEIYRISLEEAELLKVVNNAFHSLKIGFANEIGRLSDSLNLDSQKIMALVCADTKLNISPAYLKPGFAFGGSCLPKDLRSLAFNAQQLKVEIPIINSILPSNNQQIETVKKQITRLNINRLGILGLSFKAETDDLRESPVLELINQLKQEDFKILIYDPEIRPESLLGINKEYLEKFLKTKDNIILCENIEDVLSEGEAIIVTYYDARFVSPLKKIQEQKPQVTILQLQHQKI